MTGNTDKKRNLAGRLNDLSPEKRAAIEKLLKQKGIESPEISTESAAVPLIPVPRDGDLPLSFDQQRTWFLHQLDPQTSAFNLQINIQLDAPVDLLQRAVNESVARHEILRTIYRMGALEPIQVVRPPHSTELQVVDLAGLVFAGLAFDEIADRFNRIVREQRELPFDLETGPVWRAVLFKANERQTALCMTIHHIATDGWSSNRLMDELRELCLSYVRGTPAKLPPLPIQYADYAVWQRRWLTGEVIEAKLNYWRARLAGMPMALELHTDFPRPATQTDHGASIRSYLSPSLSGELKALAQNQRVTLFMTLLAIYKVLLSRYTGQTDIVAGTPIAGRNRPEVENVQGLFLNSLVLRTDLSGDISFREALERVRDTVLGSFAHQDMPFEKLVAALQPQRDLSRNPLFQAHFNKVIVPALNSKDVMEGKVYIAEGQSEFDVSLWVEEHPEVIGLVFNFNTDLFRASTIERMAGHFASLAQAVVTDPEQRLSALPLLTDDERRRLTEDWNNTRRAFPVDPFTRLFERQVAQAPLAVALMFEGEHLDYRELNARANRLAHYLRGLGVGPGIKVGICLERGLDMVIGVLGVLKAGGVYIPLDPAYPGERLAFMLEDSQATVVLSQGDMLASLPVQNAHVVNLDRDQEAIAQQGEENLAYSPGPEDLAYILYTSGSTGKPKGVQIPHRALSNFLHSMAREPGLDRSDVLVAVTTLSFDIAGLELYLPLISGARLVLASRETAADGTALAALLAACDASVMQATPATWRLLLASGWEGSPKLKILCGGEALPRDLAETLLPRCASLWNMYGPTETTIWSTTYRVESGSGQIPIGRPIANTQVFILDAHLQPVPIGVGGELYIGGAGVAHGYWRRPELTAERFIPDPFSAEPGARLYKTGDRARYLEDGNIEYLGRNDFQVKIRGFRIELGEIEAELMKHPRVREAVVAVREDVPGDKRLVAYLIAAGAEELKPEDMRAHLKADLPEYMVPSAFVMLESFPLTPNGKLDRKALPAPSGARQNVDSFYIAPQTPNEQTLAEIWCEVLGVERVSVGDNFFDIGGHSLLAIRTIVKFKEKTGKVLVARNFYQQTLGQLAASVDDPVERQIRVSNTPGFSLEPFFFGSADRTLFGLLRIAQQPRGVGVVLCQPHAHEYIRCHRAFHGLGQRLAKQGFYVLVFDYYGTGDSAGDYEDGMVSGWKDDVNTAIDALKQRMSLERVCLVGMRLGGTLAAMACAGRADVDALALWDTITTGSDIADELAKIRMLQALDPVQQRDVDYADVLGYPLTMEMVSQLNEIDLFSIARLPVPKLLILETSGEGNGHRLADRAKASGSHVEYQEIDEARVWVREPYESIVPQKAISMLVSWLSEVFS